MNVLNPYVRQFLVGWITVLDSVPYIDMLGFLPDFLDGKCIVWRMVIFFLNILYKMKVYYLIICKVKNGHYPFFFYGFPISTVQVKLIAAIVHFFLSFP